MPEMLSVCSTLFYIYSDGVPIKCQIYSMSKYCRYFLFRTIRVKYFFVTSLMMLLKEETVGTHGTDGIACLRSRWMGPGNSKVNA